jgi:hypothetical protein
MVPNRPDNPLQTLGNHLESTQNLFCYFSPHRMVTMSSDLVSLVLCYQGLAHIVKERSPEQIGITIRGTTFHRQSSVLGYIALSVVAFGLRGAGEVSEFRDSLNDPIPPPRIASPQLFFHCFEWFHLWLSNPPRLARMAGVVAGRPTVLRKGPYDSPPCGRVPSFETNSSWM